MSDLHDLGLRHHIQPLKPQILHGNFMATLIVFSGASQHSGSTAENLIVDSTKDCVAAYFSNYLGAPPETGWYMLPASLLDCKT